MELALPNLHPAIIHFPIVLIPIALVLDVGSLARRTQTMNRLAALAWLLAALAASAAFVAGRAAADGLVGIDPRVQPNIGLHADWAMWTLIVVWSLTVVRGVATFLQRPPALSYALRGLVLAAALAAQGMLFWTADLGGALVYRHAVAVTLPECPTCQAPPVQAVKGSLTVSDQDGTFTWTPNAGEATLLGSEEWPESGVVVQVDGSQTLLMPPKMVDVQLNAWVDMSRFEGEVWLLHHFDGSVGGAFIASSTKGVRLVDLNPDENVLDQSADPTPRRVALSVSAAGSHLKGMVNGEMVAHGHNSARGEGQVGLRFVGQGVVAIEKFEAIRLSSAEH